MTSVQGPAQTPEQKGFTVTGVNQYQPVDQNDRAMLDGMQGTTISGRLTLPSGASLPDPREGFVWEVDGGTLKMAMER